MGHLNYLTQKYICIALKKKKNCLDPTPCKRHNVNNEERVFLRGEKKKFRAKLSKIDGQDDEFIQYLYGSSLPATARSQSCSEVYISYIYMSI